jgi:hypothetical protein
MEKRRTMEITKGYSDSEEESILPPPLPPLQFLRMFPPKSSSPLPPPLYKTHSNHFNGFNLKVPSFREIILSERQSTPPNKPDSLQYPGVYTCSSSSANQTPPRAGQDERSCKIVKSAGRRHFKLKLYRRAPGFLSTFNLTFKD